LILKRNDNDINDYHNIEKLEKNINGLIEIINNNIEYVKNPQLFNTLQVNFNEYFLALLNYEKYNNDYDK